MNNSATNTNLQLSDIKTIDIQSKEWFDKTYGNSYFAAMVTVNYGLENCQSFFVPFTYGYGDYSKDVCFNKLCEKFEIKTDLREWQFYKENNIIMRYTKQTGCKKRDLKQENF